MTMNRNFHSRNVGYSILLAFTCCLSGCFSSFKHGPIPGVTNTLLFRACSDGDTDRVRTLLDQGANVNAREEEGETPLMYASVQDKTEVMQLLLDRGAEINATSLNGETALFRAVGMHRYKATELLISRGADIEKGNPLIYAAGIGDVPLIKLLLQKGAKVNATDSDGNTALAAAVNRRVSPQVVRTLMDAGAIVDTRNNRGETPLLVAKRNGDEQLISLLSSSQH